MASLASAPGTEEDVAALAEGRVKLAGAEKTSVRSSPSRILKTARGGEKNQGMSGAGEKPQM